MLVDFEAWSTIHFFSYRHWVVIATSLARKSSEASSGAVASGDLATCKTNSISAKLTKKL